MADQHKRTGLKQLRQSAKNIGLYSIDYPQDIHSVVATMLDTIANYLEFEPGGPFRPITSQRLRALADKIDKGN